MSIPVACVDSGRRYWLVGALVWELLRRESIQHVAVIRWHVLGYHGGERNRWLRHRASPRDDGRTPESAAERSDVMRLADATTDMEYTTLGSTGLSVSRIALGTMNLGYESEGWRLDEAESREILERAIDLGITFIDTANVYRDGASEEVVGDVIDEHDRDELVVASKVYGSMDDENPNAQGLSRKAIEQELANSLDRLGLETIDLYQIHRYDEETSIDETLRTLDDAVRRGEVRYLGASSMWAHQFADALHTSDRLGLERFVSMQNHYNPVYREEEREMLPLCENEGIGVIPWSPLARGYVTRPHDAFETTARASEESDGRGDRHAIYRDGGGREINRRIEELADEYGVSMAQLAIAWHLHTEPVTAPIVGVSSVDQLEEAVEAVDISLSDSDREYIEEPYEPVEISGHE